MVRTGLDVLLAQDFRPLRGLRVGVVTHPAAVDRHLRSWSEVARLATSQGVAIGAFFGPEHGFDGAAQDLMSVPNSQGDIGAPVIPVYSLYGDTYESLQPTDEQLKGLDALVIDLQDIGARYYTFQATMLFCLRAASQRGLLTVVLDRPNPLGGIAIEGPALQSGYESFVGIHAVATRHGMTIGELARMYQTDRHLPGELVVIRCEGWRREMSLEQTGLPWVMPSPNMPTVDTVYVYPGQCLLEGTNLSEGRGTTRPFELCGAPWIDPGGLAERLRAEELPGVIFRPAWFRPTHQKFAGQTCGGVQLHVADRETFQPVRTGLAVLATCRELSGPNFDWRRQPYEFVADRLAIDLLFGSDRERRALEAGRPVKEIARAWDVEEAAFRERRKAYLLY